LGRKVHPIGFRLGYTKTWESRWFAEGPRYAALLEEDRQIRKLIQERMERAGISRIEIQRFPRRVLVGIHTAKPGIVIGRKGSSVNLLKTQLQELTGKSCKVDVHEIERPELDAHLVAENVAQQLERRTSQKRAMKQAVSRSMRSGAKGVKIKCSGRLGGAEMSRSEWVREGRVPLHTLRADIDYAVAEAVTTFGRIGVKVWIYRGDILPGELESGVPQEAV
jgi:small subunit ribosomal protein S3